MGGQENEKRRKLVRRIRNYTALTLLVSQIPGAVKAFEKVRPENSLISSSQSSQVSSEKRAKRPHGGSKIEAQVISTSEGSVSSSSEISKRNRSQRKIDGKNTTIYEAKGKGGKNSNLSIGNDSNLKLAHVNSTGLIRPVDIDKKIREEKEKQGLYKLIALIERFDPQGAMMIIDKLSSAKVSIGALEQQAAEIINKNLGALVAVMPIEDIQKVTHFDFSSIDQSSPVAAVTEGLL